MAVNRERELKFHIGSLDDFLALRDAADLGTRGQPIRQVNRYFDTSDLLLAGQGIMLRAREAEQCYLTLKCGREVSAGTFDSQEFESVISRSCLLAALESPVSLLDLNVPAIGELTRRVGRPPLEVAGTLVNERLRREFQGRVLELDRMTFPDESENYELEMETDDLASARLWLEELLRARGVRFEPQTLTKFEQLLEWYRTHGDKRSIRPARRESR
jgi:uncharacterized protein YjbK